MSKKHLIFIAILCVFLASCAKTDNSIFKKTDLSYFELASRGSCDPFCHKETLVFSNGLVFLNYEENKNVINESFKVGYISKQKAEELIELADLTIPQGKNGGFDCKGCSRYNLFLLKKNNVKAISMLSKNANQGIIDLDRATTLATQELSNRNDFFIHFIFQKKGKNSVDYHFYFDGTVLVEEFGEEDGDLINAQIFTLNESQLNFIRESLTPDFFASSSVLEDCSKRKLIWGYMEGWNGSEFLRVFTCGNGKSPADILYSKLLTLTEKNGN